MFLGVQTLVWADGLNSQTKVWTPSPTLHHYLFFNSIHTKTLEWRTCSNANKSNVLINIEHCYF